MKPRGQRAETSARDTAESRAGAAERELVITRTFDAPRSLVYEAWTTQSHAMQWWCPQGFTVVSLQMDVRPGGAWRKCMRSPEGQEYWRHGVYREVVAPERLVLTYLSDDVNSKPGHETLVTVTFSDLGEKTRLTLRQTDFESAAARDSHLGGWTSCMDVLAAFVARME